MSKKLLTIVVVIVMALSVAVLFKTVLAADEPRAKEQRVKTLKITKTILDFNNAPNFEVALATLPKEAEILSVQAMVTKRFIYPDDPTPDGFVVFARGTNQVGDTCGLASKPAAVINPLLEEFSQPGLLPTLCNPNFEKQIFVGNFAGITGKATQGKIDFYISYIKH